MPEIVYAPGTPEEEQATLEALLRAIRGSAARLRELRARRAEAQKDSVVKVQHPNLDSNIKTKVQNG